MAIFKKKKKIQSAIVNSQEESRSPNHWTYNDDPILNMEPIFTDDVNSKSIKIQSFVEEKNMELEVNTSSEASEKLKNLREKIGELKKTSVEGVLGSIINGAREKSQIIQNEVIENDPVIAKLQKIEELKKTGGVDVELYTDVTKIQNKGVNYSERAKAFHEEHSTKIIESDLERAKRLTREAQEARNSQKDNSDKTSGIFKMNQDKTIDISENLKNLNKQHKSKILFLEQEVKEKINQIVDIKKKYLDQEAEETIQGLNLNNIDNEVKKEKFLLKKLKEFDKVLQENSEYTANLIKPRRLQKTKNKVGDSNE
ncbi:hypothetical protein [Spiroplasma taiwanense]|uniref:Uncharacterized protein n=1 Tax=Spiroplasma taiwanense CT-1 TaxID=1276220 RepID=S5MCW1_9MOLU|nr:hypothetical protein [Spiroplasma taiwanense]AGR41563.1 hypothetical protein STAIW_v1c09770 [Spiroplasma taiwanense CT-1]